MAKDLSSLDPNATLEDASAASIERRAAIISLTVGLLLMAIKFLAYLFTGSSAIFSDALESIVNVLASAFALFAIHYSHLPADRSHPYGHGKVEFFSVFLEGALISIAGIGILFKSVYSLFNTLFGHAK